MRRMILVIASLALVALACGVTSPTPALDIHTVETIAAGTLTAIAPTQSPPTLIPLPTLTLAPSATPFPTLPPPPGKPIRIQFSPGGISSTVSNTVTFPNRVEYILWAAQGQQMTVSINSAEDAANFAILGVSDNFPLKRLENEDRVWTGILPTTQDYILSVAVPDGSAAFTLTVTIIWL